MVNQQKRYNNKIRTKLTYIEQQKGECPFFECVLPPYYCNSTGNFT